MTESTRGGKGEIKKRTPILSVPQAKVHACVGNVRGVRWIFSLDEVEIFNSIDLILIEPSRVIFKR